MVLQVKHEIEEHGKERTVHAEGGYKASVKRGDAKRARSNIGFVTLASASVKPVKRTAPSTRQIKTPALPQLVSPALIMP